MGIELSGKVGMGMRCWTGNGNGIGMRMIPREWEVMGTTIVIPAYLYHRAQKTEFFCAALRPETEFSRPWT